ncbi:molybdopterin dinucleotide binding domain-containing protein [Pseudohalioglobus lutimaris]|uniref:molybdopterin dinucleotide binding domain-containing protein n=1 Tax=Pseudohalioglobus lutimaris TaxID=1737061 RepID=UPI0013FD7626|nr:molybdopterin dinucleotide binding domain-containing protein [Pseudohalioglobus lutimaris]
MTERIIETGDVVRLATKAGACTTVVEVTEIMQLGHMSIPNGSGFDNKLRFNEPTEHVGVNVNQLTYTDHGDVLAGTPWHKHVPATVEKIS